MDSVELGFVKKTASWKLRSKFFPSKVGGQPAWLSLKNLPEPSDLVCKNCGNPCIFLLQIYANIDESNDTFHRSIFVFMCRNGKCIKRFSNESFIIFRTQLPRKNDFYPFEPPMEEESTNCPSAGETLCDVCGCKAVITCDKCSQKNYCSDIHRRCDWNQFHKDSCGTESGIKKKKSPSNPFILPEFEIECDTEDLPPEQPEKSTDEKMREFQNFMKSPRAPKELLDVPLDDFDGVMKQKDKAFNKFRKKVDHYPDQILRYHRGRIPLLVSAEFVPKDSDIPPCRCGAKRIFEFQIMSQILVYLSLDSVAESPDWGTLLIYTCSKSCDEGTGNYVQEFMWKQDFSNTE